MASSRSVGTSFIRAKSGTHKPCLSARLRRKSSGSTSIERSPRSTPKRRKRLMVRPAIEPLAVLCNAAIPISILRRLEPSGNHGVARVAQAEIALKPARRGRCLERGKKTAVLLDAAKLFGKLHFLYGDDATIRSFRSRA